MWPGPDIGTICARPIHDTPTECALSGIIRESAFRHELVEDPDTPTLPRRSNKDIDNVDNSIFTVGQVYEFLPPANSDDPVKLGLLNAIHPISYSMNFTVGDDDALQAAIETFWVNQSTGFIRVNASQLFQNVTVSFIVKDSKLREDGIRGDELVLKRWVASVLVDDTILPSNGPRGSDCAIVDQRVDGTRFDRTFTCNCVEYGDNLDANCNTIPVDSTAIVLLIIVSLFLVLVGIVALVWCVRSLDESGIQRHKDRKLRGDGVANVKDNQIGITFEFKSDTTDSVFSGGLYSWDSRNEIDSYKCRLTSALVGVLQERLNSDKAPSSLSNVFAETIDSTTLHVSLNGTAELVLTVESKAKARRTEQRLISYLRKEGVSFRDPDSDPQETYISNGKNIRSTVRRLNPNELSPSDVLENPNVNVCNDLAGRIRTLVDNGKRLPVVAKFSELVTVNNEPQRTPSAQNRYEELQRLYTENNLIREAEILMYGKEEDAENNLLCKFIVSLRGIVRDGESVYYIRDYYEDAQPLVSFVTDAQQPAETRLTCCFQVASALEYLSKRSIVHCSVAARNILVTRPTKDTVLCRLKGFGRSVRLERDTQNACVPDDPDPRNNLWRWQPIEVLQADKDNRRYSTASDVWSFGVLVYEVMSRGEDPWSDLSDLDENTQIAQLVQRMDKMTGPDEERLVNSNNCEPNDYDVYDYVMRPCWRRSPSHRPSWKKLLKRLDVLGARTDGKVEETVAEIEMAKTMSTKEEKAKSRTVFDALADVTVWPIFNRGLLLAAIFFYYFDFYTDIFVVKSLLSPESGSSSTVKDEARTAGIVLIAILLVGPTIVTLVDVCVQPLKRRQKDGAGLTKGTEKKCSIFMDHVAEYPRIWGAILNFTNTRIMYFGIPALLGWQGASEKMAAFNSGKFFEVLVEALPQLFLQTATLAAGLITLREVVLSITMSMINIAFSCTSQVLAMYGWAILDDRSRAKALGTSFITLLYFVADSGSRASAMYLRVSRSSMSFKSVGHWLLWWLLGDLIVRGVLLLYANVDEIRYHRRVDLNSYPRGKWWAIDPSVVSSLSSILTAMPLSRNPTERRWLFGVSTIVAVSSASQALQVQDGRSELQDLATLLFMICIVVKMVLYLIGELILFRHLDAGYKGLTNNYGIYLFVWSDRGSNAERARKKVDWVAKYEGDTKREAMRQRNLPDSATREVNLDWECPERETQGFEQVRARFEALHHWLRGLDSKDALSRILLREGAELSRFDKLHDPENAKKEIELRREQRNLITRLDTFPDTWDFRVTGFAWMNGIDWSDKKDSSVANQLKLILASVPISDLRFCHLKFESEADADTAMSVISSGLAEAQIEKMGRHQRLFLSSSGLRWPTGASDLAMMLAVNTTIRELDLSSNAIGPSGGTVIANALRHNRTIVKISLKDTKLGYVGGVAIARALKENMTITNINLERNSIGGERGLGGEELVRVFEQNLWIRVMQLEENPITADDRVRISKFLARNCGYQARQTSQLVATYEAGEIIPRELVPEPQDAKKEALLRFSALSFWLRRLEALDELDRQSSTAFSDQAIASRRTKRNRITTAPWHMHFEYLADSPWRDENFRLDFARILASVPISDLIFSNCAETLDLDCNIVILTIAIGLAHAQFDATTTQRLDLSRSITWSDGAGLAITQMLMRNTTITVLDLSNNHLGKFGGIELARVIEVNRTLIKVKYVVQPTKDKEVVSSAADSTPLTSFSLSNTQLGVVGGHAIASALKQTRTRWPTIKSLNLSNNNMNGKSLEVAMCENVTITDLEYEDGNRVTPMCVVNIQFSLSQNRIIADKQKRTTVV